MKKKRKKERKTKERRSRENGVDKKKTRKIS
jgi:hypothetical protein